ncbi:GNAT family N-acetyltransferase [Luteolibacter sp. SL250]|uniref:GNAT family N-acetyltransferase n=1 Tax=Luteolibacter sp. SL250 TaxID=2995170 RepID=UPI00227041B4|nr:GNAT family N-acetyltransferase [Luteolibacter sp. SL250]WAC21505.1 GNAT family N-acetyltransferase [Luteolibacter sp. SL250]
MAFLWELHVATMRGYVERTWGWDETFQRDHFHKTFSPEHLRILTCGGRDIGVLETHLHPDHLFLARISILPSRQNRGIGTRIIRPILQDAGERNLPVRLQVLKVNPARFLYERMGFTTCSETTTHFMMTRPPSSVKIG